MAWLAYGIKAQRLPGDIGLDTGRAISSGETRISSVFALFGKLAFELPWKAIGSGQACRGRLASKCRGMPQDANK